MSESRASPKFDFVFQSKIISLQIKNTKFLEFYGNVIKPEYFSDPSHQSIAEIISNYWEKYSKNPTYEVLIDEIQRSEDKSKVDLLAKVLEETIEQKEEDFKYYEDKVLEFCKRQSALIGIRQAAEKLKGGDLESILPTIEKSLEVGTAFDPNNFGMDYWQALDKEELQKVVPKIPTLMGESGMGGLDDVLRGGLAKGNLGIMIMPTGKGKSIFLTNLAGNAVFQGYNVAYISLELSESQVSKRFNTFFSGYTEDEIEKFEPKDFKENLLRNLKGVRLGNLLIKQFPNKGASVREIESYLKMAKSRLGWFPDLIAWDYLDIIKAPFRSKETYEQLRDVSDQLKSFCQRHEIPCWTATQANKEGASKKIIRNEHSANSYSKLDSADVVLTCNPKVDEETGLRMAEVFCTKNRQGVDQISADFEIDLKRMRYIFRPKEARTAGALQLYEKYKKQLKR